MIGLHTDAIQVSVRAAAAAALAFWVAELLGADYAIYALVGAVLVTDLSPAKSRRLAVQRMAGTLIGAAAGGLLLNVLPNGPIALGMAICGAMLVAYAAGFEIAAARVAGYVAAIVMFAHRDEPWRYAFDRAWETVVGILSALLVGVVPLWLRDKRS
jgi:uncharacterized membrane protein YgaE (UPF0421/DUF939 family)